jgi:hypothetical protein
MKHIMDIKIIDPDTCASRFLDPGGQVADLRRHASTWLPAHCIIQNDRILEKPSRIGQYTTLKINVDVDLFNLFFLVLNI